MKTFDPTNLPMTDEQAEEMLRGAPDENERLGKTLLLIYACHREQGMPIANAYLTTIYELVTATRPGQSEQQPTTKYCIVTKPTIPLLQKRIQQMIDIGWIPQGGPFVIHISHNRMRHGTAHNINVHYSQAMIHYLPTNQEQEQ